MLLLLDTSTPTCRLSFVSDSERSDIDWLAERQLAHGLLSFLNEQLVLRGLSWTSIDGIGVYRGPGSFTGLRIGLTVLNTLADSAAIPIVGVSGNDWQETALRRLKATENDRIVLPLYGADAHITKQRK